jgi:hypothetical protein
VHASPSFVERRSTRLHGQNFNEVLRSFVQFIREERSGNSWQLVQVEVSKAWQASMKPSKEFSKKSCRCSWCSLMVALQARGFRDEKAHLCDSGSEACA